MDFKKEFISYMHKIDTSKNLSSIFHDFLSLSTYAIAQPFYRSPEIEQKYLNIIRSYPKEQAEIFSQMFALVVLALEKEHQDFLGKIYEDNRFGDIRKGQYFTPYNVAKMMAEINTTDLEQKLNTREIITISEPCCGSGVMVIAFAETMKEKNFNYQQQMYAEVIDLDEMCYKMAYIQLSLLGIPAKVMHGDSLAWKFHQVIYTPFYFLNNFEYRLKQRHSENKVVETVDTIIIEPTQLSLFK